MVRFLGVCGLDGHSQVAMDGLMTPQEMDHAMPGYYRTSNNFL